LIDGATTGELKVRSIDRFVAQDPTATTVSTTITIAGTSATNDVDHPTDATFTPAAPITFDVEIVNPCVTATITPLVFTPSNPSVKDGESVFTDWTTPTSSVDVAHGNTGLCGPMTYAVFNDNDGTDTLPSDAAA
jgi:hypothetical protein